MDLDVEQIIVKVKIAKNGKILATAQLQFGPFIWRGFRIMEGIYKNKLGNNLWIQPPSYKNKEGKFPTLFFCDDKILWEKITEKIIHEFDEQNNEVDSQTNEDLTDEDYEKLDMAITQKPFLSKN